MNPQASTPTALYDHPKYWAECLLPAPFLPMSRQEMDQLGWDSCDVILVTGDAYVDHPSFGMAVIGRVLEAQGFRVGIISQPDWRDAESYKVLGLRKGCSKNEKYTQQEIKQYTISKYFYGFRRER